MAAKIAPASGETHQLGSFWHDAILGGQDGLVNVLGIILGVVAANGHTQVLIAASLAAAVAESISMAAVAYTSSQAEKDHYEKEIQRERYEMAHIPDVERQEVRDIYVAKGFSGDLLEKIVSTVTSNDEIWLKTMMKEELNLNPVDTQAVLRTSLIVGVTAVIGSLIPVSPYFLFPRGPALVLSLSVSAVTLFAIGAYEAKTYIGSWWKNGLRLSIIGMAAAFAGFLIGSFFHAP